jgi:Flp pilus assembly protein TadD
VRIAAGSSGGPDNSSLLDTRGHVLLWNGRLEEAERHLLRAYALRSNASGRASSAAGLALVYSKTNRRDEALAWLARAREQDAHQPVVARAIAAVDPLHRS